MNQRLKHALTALERLPAERQDELAAALEVLAAAPLPHSPGLLDAIDEGLADAEAGRFASGEEVSAFFARMRMT